MIADLSGQATLVALGAGFGSVFPASGLYPADVVYPGARTAARIPGGDGVSTATLLSDPVTVTLAPQVAVTATLQILELVT